MTNIKSIAISTIILIVLLLVGVTVFLPKFFQSNTIYISGAIENKIFAYDFARAEEYLNKYGMQAKLIETTGPIEVATLLSDPKSKLNAAFVFDGLLTQLQTENLYSLGSVSYDPIWIFYNDKVVGKLSSIEDLSKQKVLIGPKESDSYFLTKKLFELNGINIEDNPNFISLPLEDRLTEFLSGKSGVMIFSGPFSADVIKKSFYAGGKLFEIPNVDNYETKSNFIVLDLPAGSMDVNGTMPAKDTKLLATTTLLAVKKDLDPSLQLGLLITATEMIRENPFKYKGEVIKFPAPMFASSLKISPTAMKYYEGGLPIMIKRYPSLLPYWPLL
jgi:TRAP-type uncharacterized transport system substrate-binding protein